jgi:5-methylcytosine-specific restriction endonuclease McrA
MESKRNPHKTLVLNSAYMATHIIDSTRAFVVVYKGNADILDTHPGAYFKTPNTSTKYEKPSVIRVNKWINLNYTKSPLTRENVFKRDSYQCVYCGESRRPLLTLDHVYPRSKGGADSWENLVTACKRCNGEKGNLLIDEWGKSDPKPVRPHHILLVQKNQIVIPDEWKPYLFL